MKKPTRKPEVAPRLLNSSELANIRGGDGGITADDDWESRKLRAGSDDTGTPADSWESPVV